MTSFIAKIVAPALLVSSLLVSCSKKDNPATVTTTPTGSGKVKMEFFNNVGGSSLNMGNQWYQNAHGDSFRVSRFDYYITNIKLNGTNVSYAEDSSFHLLQQLNLATMTFDMAKVPAGVYNSVTLTIGVDSADNTTGAQTGDLDPIKGMFWTWNTGYIMLKFEGTSPVATSTGGAVTYHAGGYSGPNSVVRTVTMNFPNPITVNATTENHIHLTADVQALFKAPNLIDFAVAPSMQNEGESAKNFADNYMNMFTVSYAGL